MRMFWGAALLPLSVTITACGPTANALRGMADAIAPVPSAKDGAVESPQKLMPLPEVVLDQSSPDRALRTHFAYQDRLAAFAFNRAMQMRGLPPASDIPPMTEAIHLYDGPIKEYASKRLGLVPFRDSEPVLRRYDREIIKLTNESETRVVAEVRIRATAPIPAGAVPTEHDITSRRDGQVFRFILSKGPKGWQIEDVLEFGYGIGGLSKGEHWHRIDVVSILTDKTPSVQSIAQPLLDIY